MRSEKKAVQRGSSARLWAVLGLGWLLAGCAHRETAAGSRDEGSRWKVTDYYPLAVGNRWTYESEFLGEKRDDEVEIVRSVDGFFEDSMGGALMVDAYGVRDRKRYLLREPIEVGRTWTNVVSVSAVEHYSVLEAGVACEVPAGRFEACVRVEGRIRVNEQTSLVNELTFAPKVGLVRVRTFAQTGTKRVPQVKRELKRFQLAAAQVGQP